MDSAEQAARALREAFRHLTEMAGNPRRDHDGFVSVLRELQHLRENVASVVLRTERTELAPEEDLWHVKSTELMGGILEKMAIEAARHSTPDGMEKLGDLLARQKFGEGLDGSYVGLVDGYQVQVEVVSWKQASAAL